MVAMAGVADSFISRENKLKHQCESGICYHHFIFDSVEDIAMMINLKVNCVGRLEKMGKMFCHGSCVQSPGLLIIRGRWPGILYVAALQPSTSRFICKQLEWQFIELRKDSKVL